MGGTVKVSDRGDGKLIARAEIDGKPVQVYRTRRGTVTIEVGDQPIYGLSTEGARRLTQAINALLDFETNMTAVANGIGDLLNKNRPTGWAPPRGPFTDQD